MIKCIIVDDERLAQNVLERYISRVSWLQLSGKCDNAIDAIAFLRSNEVDLMFLDIQMPELSGLKMLDTVCNPPKVILTTAFSEYALESYEYSVIDYLLKPIEFERFIKAINKLVEPINSENGSNNDVLKQSDENYIFVSQDLITERLNTKQILFIQANGNYVNIFTEVKKYIVRMTMHEIESKLSDDQFIRVHKSYIVAESKIDRLLGNIIRIGDNEIPVGTMYKLNLLKSMQSK